MIASNQNIKFTVIHKDGNPSLNNGMDLVRFAVCNEPLSGMIFSCLNSNTRNRRNNETIAIPEAWKSQSTKTNPSIVYYKENLPILPKLRNRLKSNSWLLISNGRYATHADNQLLNKILNQSQSNIVAVNIVPQLQAFQEKVLITATQSKLVGFRRFYDDCAQLAPIPDDWPHHLFIKTHVLNKLQVDGTLPLVFSRFIDACSANSLTVCSLNIGGTVWELGKEEDLLALLTSRLSSLAKNPRNAGKESWKQFLSQNGNGIKTSPTIRLFGKVSFGQNVSIGQNVTIVGPAIIGNGVKIAK